MNLDKYQQAWKADSAQMQVSVDTDLLAKEVQHSHENFQSTIFWRDVREAGISLFLIPIWLVIGYTMSLSWTWYLGIPAFIFVAGFILLDRKRNPQRASEPGEPLVFYVNESLTQVEHQIRLLRNVFWWYLLPFGLPCMAFFLDTAWATSSDWLEFVLFGGFLNLFLVVMYWGVYRLNQSAVRGHLEPRRQDLVKLVQSLESETTDDDAGDIMELVSALADPVRNVGLSPGWGRWAENWNRIVPSWREAAWIILPTLIGACCGFWYSIPDMGPVLFQAVVAAVISFEVAVGIVWLRSHQKQKRVIAAGDEVNSQDGSVSSAKADTELLATPKRLPRAPAFVILVLTLLIGVMAFVALYAFFAEIHGTSTRASKLEDVSAFDDEAISHLDAWMQRMFDDTYPSLSAVIVRDGEVVYQGVFGLEDIQEHRQATPQTQYNVASVTKAFTASLAVILHERGVIDLDQPVVKYLPNGVSISTTPEIGATITLRQLATHTSGLPRGVPGRVQSVEGWYELEPQRLYDHLAKVTLNQRDPVADLMLKQQPDYREEYSNLGYGLLGHALELAADKPLDQLMQELICDPLMLTRTAIQSDETLRPATNYPHGSRIAKTHSFQERLAASEGLVASIEDLGKFLAAQMKPGVFSREMLEQLHAETKLPDGSPSGRSLGWSVRQRESIGRILKKNGGRSNCSAWIGFAPEHGVGVAVVTNCGGPDVDLIGYRLLEASIPLSQKKLVTKDGYAKVAPYTGIRWEQDTPIVCVNGQWQALVSINEIPIARIMEFANKEYRGKAQKRFAEDLVEVMAKMGYQPDWKVTLELRSEDGQVEKSQVLMTKEKRELVRKSLHL